MYKSLRMAHEKLLMCETNLHWYGLYLAIPLTFSNVDGQKEWKGLHGCKGLEIAEWLRLNPNRSLENDKIFSNDRFGLNILLLSSHPLQRFHIL